MISNDIEGTRASNEDRVAAGYAPTGAVMYAEAFQTRVVPGALADLMEGPGRPGHFEGVATVVLKLRSCC